METQWDIYGVTDDVCLNYLLAAAASAAASAVADPDRNAYQARAAYWAAKVFRACGKCEEMRDPREFGKHPYCKPCLKERKRGLDYPRQETGSKVCPCCNQVLGVVMFASNRRNKDGLQTYCKVCMNEKVKASRLRKQGKKPKIELKAHPNYVKVTEKECRRCGETKLAADFPANFRISDGLHSYCRVCSRKAVNESRRRRVSS